MAKALSVLCRVRSIVRAFGICLAVLSASIANAEDSLQDAKLEKHAWRSITYPPLPILNSEKQFRATLSPERDDLKYLELSLTCWSLGQNAPESPMKAPLAIRVHRNEQTDDGTDMVWLGGSGFSAGPGITHMLTWKQEWGRNDLAEAWIELKLSDRTYWLEVPYGFMRDPREPLPPSEPHSGRPKLATAMKELGDLDRLVAWDEVEYRMGEVPGKGPGIDPSSPRILIAWQSNPFDAQCRLQLHGNADLQVPKMATHVEHLGKTLLVGACMEIRYDQHLLSRFDTFKFNRGAAEGRGWGKLVGTVEGKEYSATIPSSLYLYVHGVAEPGHKQMIKAPIPGGYPLP